MSNQKENIKPMTHDATPSWNGFNYQGKVGLYVCLEIILEKLNALKPQESELKNIFQEFQIEYEWIEDFAIKNNGQYISIHQVKNYQDSEFSFYKDAIETILARRLKVVPNADVKRHFPMPSQGTVEVVVENFISELFKNKIIGDSYEILNDWEEGIKSLAQEESKKIAHDILSNLCRLHEETYGKNIPVYLHSFHEISKPKLALENYKWKLDIVKTTLKGKTLKDLEININKSLKFHLALNDDCLMGKIKILIGNVRKIINPESTETQSEESMTCYVAAILHLIDQHIASRHKLFRGVDSESADSNSISPATLCFSDIINILIKNYHIQNEDYFALRAKWIFEAAISDQINSLTKVISIKKGGNLAFQQELTKIERIEKFRMNVISPMPPLDLLKHLERSSPNKKMAGSYDIYFPGIVQAHGINSVLLKFVELLEKTPEKFFAITPELERICPSCIDAADDDLDIDVAYQILAQEITEACDHNAYIDSLLYDFNHIAIKVNNDSEQPFYITPPKFDIIEDNQQSSSPIFHEKKKTQLISYKLAAKKVNGTSC